MKGCLLLQRGFAYLGNDIAAHLKNTYGINNFCGYVYLRSSYDFLKSQKDITYSELILDEEIHKLFIKEKIDYEYLASLERDYGIPYLWPFLAVDRVLMSSQLVHEYPYDRPMYSHEDMLRILQVKARAVIKMLQEEKPDFLFCTGALGGTGSLLLYHVAKKMGIKIFVALPTCSGGRYILSEEYDSFSSIRNFHDYEKRPLSYEARMEAEKFLKEFREKPTAWLKKLTPSAQAINRKKQFVFLLPNNAIRSIVAICKMIYAHFTKSDKNDYSYISPWNQLRDKFLRKFDNLIGVNDLYDETLPGEDFAFFPLHLEPEAALLLQAPYYANQLHLIRQIARSLPVHYKLYVKEHPQMVEYRRRSWYKELKKIPNVKLINPALRSYDIIPDAKLVTTITGTAGWEAVLFKKPVINFGIHFYNALPRVKRCDAIENLPKVVKEQIETFIHDEDELIAFLTAIFEESVDVSMHRLWEDETDLEKKRRGIKPLADLLASKLITK